MILSQTSTRRSFSFSLSDQLLYLLFSSKHYSISIGRFLCNVVHADVSPAQVRCTGASTPVLSTITNKRHGKPKALFKQNPQANNERAPYLSPAFHSTTQFSSQAFSVIRNQTEIHEHFHQTPHHIVHSLLYVIIISWRSQNPKKKPETRHRGTFIGIYPLPFSNQNQMCKIKIQDLELICIYISKMRSGLSVSTLRAAKYSAVSSVNRSFLNVNV